MLKKTAGCDVARAFLLKVLLFKFFPFKTYLTPKSHTLLDAKHPFSPLAHFTSVSVCLY